MYVTGSTAAIDFPTTVGTFDASWNGGGSDVFVAKLDASGAELVYSTYLGGSGADVGTALAVDFVGSAYLTGSTSSADFPITPGAFDASAAGGDAFVTKLDPLGSALEYSTYLGGTGFDRGNGIAVDHSGSAYVTGQTSSRDFPTTAGAFDTSANGAFEVIDAFVTKLNVSGAALLYSTYLGGSRGDFARSIAVDTMGNAYVTGSTSSVDFPTTAGAFDTILGCLGCSSFDDAFMTKLDVSGAGLAYSTYLGGSGFDHGFAIAVAAGGVRVYVTGLTGSVDFPTTVGALDTSWNGSSDVFVMRFDTMGPASTALVYSTYLGGSGYDQPTGIAANAVGSVYVTGLTLSANFPTTANAVEAPPWNDRLDGFVTKLDQAGAALAFSSRLGGSGSDTASGIALDPRGDSYIVGSTDSADFPTTAGAFDSTPNGQSDAFVVKLSFGLREVTDESLNVIGLQRQSVPFKR